jgi:hypothetical protein
MLLPGVVAWLITVFEPARQPGAPLTVRVATALAIVSLLLGTGLPPTRPLVSRLFGLHAFVFFCLLSWLSFDTGPLPERVDRGRALFGALAWLLFAFGWGRTRSPASSADDARIVPGPTLAPRSRLPRAAIVVALVATVSGLLLALIAFRVERAEQALLSHAAATACGLLLLAAAGRIALAQGQRYDLASARHRLDAASVPGALIGILLGLGLVWAALR